MNLIMEKENKLQKMLDATIDQKKFSEHHLQSKKMGFIGMVLPVIYRSIRHTLLPAQVNYLRQPLSCICVQKHC